MPRHHHTLAQGLEVQDGNLPEVGPKDTNSIGLFPDLNSSYFYCAILFYALLNYLNIVYNRRKMLRHVTVYYS